MAYPRTTTLQLRKRVSRLRAQVYYWKRRALRLRHLEAEMALQVATSIQSITQAHKAAEEESRQRIAYLEHKLAGYMRDYAPLHAIRDRVADLALASRQADMPFSYHDALVAFDVALRRRPLHDHES